MFNEQNTVEGPIPRPLSCKERGETPPFQGGAGVGQRNFYAA